ncbi:MAG: hypothetical protein HYZ75_18675 [Elusimicrobia bacterium]|nr:hypothetical protein [Elusimicrobiota bacterium]
MRRKGRGERGAVLVYVLVAAMLLSMVAFMVLRWSFGSRLVLAKSQGRTQAVSLMEAVRAQASACLYDTGYPTGTCSPSGAQAACLPSSYQGHSVSVSLGGSMPDCKMRISFER